MSRAFRHHSARKMSAGLGHQRPRGRDHLYQRPHDRRGSHLPFDGVKATGNGHREGGIGAIDFYTEWKAVYVDYSDKLQKAQIDRVE